MSYLRTFSCVAYTRELGQLRKLDDRGKAGVFIDYVEGAKVYRGPRSGDRTRQGEPRRGV